MVVSTLNKIFILPDVVYLILLYKKGKKDSLTQSEKNALKEAELIAKGEMKPANVTRYEIADVKAIRAQLDVSQKEYCECNGC